MATPSPCGALILALIAWRGAGPVCRWGSRGDGPCSGRRRGACVGRPLVGPRGAAPPVPAPGRRGGHLRSRLQRPLGQPTAHTALVPGGAALPPRPRAALLSKPPARRRAKRGRDTRPVRALPLSRSAFRGPGASWRPADPTSPWPAPPPPSSPPSSSQPPLPPRPAPPFFPYLPSFHLLCRLRLHLLFAASTAALHSFYPPLCACMRNHTLLLSAALAVGTGAAAAPGVSASFPSGAVLPSGLGTAPPTNSHDRFSAPLSALTVHRKRMNRRLLGPNHHDSSSGSQSGSAESSAGDSSHSTQPSSESHSNPTTKPSTESSTESHESSQSARPTHAPASLSETGSHSASDTSTSDSPATSSAAPSTSSHSDTSESSSTQDPDTDAPKSDSRTPSALPSPPAAPSKSQTASASAVVASHVSEMSANKASVSASLASASSKLDQASSDGQSSSLSDLRASLATAASMASASAVSASSQFYATVQTAVTVTSSAPPGSTHAGTAQGKPSSSSSHLGTIVGASVGGAVGAIAILALILWRFCGKGARDAGADDIRWPELKADHDMTGAAMQPLPARRTGGAGFDMGEDSDAEDEDEAAPSPGGMGTATATGVGAGGLSAPHHDPSDDFASDHSTDKYGSQYPAYGVSSSTALAPNHPGHGAVEGYDPSEGYGYDQSAADPRAAALARDSSMRTATEVSGSHVNGFAAPGIDPGPAGMQPQGYYDPSQGGQMYALPPSSISPMGYYPQDRHSSIGPMGYYPQESYADYDATVPSGTALQSAELAPGMPFNPSYQQQVTGSPYPHADVHTFPNPYEHMH